MHPLKPNIYIYIYIYARALIIYHIYSKKKNFIANKRAVKINKGYEVDI
jgi:hypothetical protein